MKKAFFTFSILAFPVLVSAVTPQNFGEVTGLFSSIIRTLILPLIAGLTILAFIWGTGQFIRNAGEAKSHEKGKQLLVAGVVGLFLFVTIYGILSFLYDDFGFTNSGNVHPQGFFVTLPQ